MPLISTGLAFKNNTGETIAPGAALEITANITEEGEIIWTIQKPTTAGIGKGLIVFNGGAEVVDGAGGESQHGPIVIARSDGTAMSLGDECGPVNNSWEVAPSGTGCTYLDDCDLFEQAVMLRINLHGFRLYRFTLKASLASGTADANILEMDGTDTEVDANVLDPLGIFASLTSIGAAGICVMQGGIYYVIQAPCPA